MKARAQLLSGGLEYDLHHFASELEDSADRSKTAWEWIGSTETHILERLADTGLADDAPSTVQHCLENYVQSVENIISERKLFKS